MNDDGWIDDMGYREPVKGSLKVDINEFGVESRWACSSALAPNRGGKRGNNRTSIDAAAS